MIDLTGADSPDSPLPKRPRHAPGAAESAIRDRSSNAQGGVVIVEAAAPAPIPGADLPLPEGEGFEVLVDNTRVRLLALL